MKKLIVAAGLAAFASTLPVMVSAQAKKEESPHTFTGNLNFVSEYRYRGIAQTNAKPAIQGGFDYAHKSGFYAGTWASNVSWLSDAGGGAVSNSIEWDFYGGYKGSLRHIGYDVGLLQYWYPGTYPKGFTSPDTLEVYAAATWKTVTVKYSHSLTNLFGYTDSKGAGYLDITGTYEIASGINLVGHYGYQSVPATNGRAKKDCSYGDWKVGVTADAVGMTFGASYIGTDAKGGVGECYRNPFNRDLGKGTVVLSVTKTF